MRILAQACDPAVALVQRGSIAQWDIVMSAGGLERWFYIVCPSERKGGNRTLLLQTGEGPASCLGPLCYVHIELDLVSPEGLPRGRAHLFATLAQVYRTTGENCSSGRGRLRKAAEVKARGRVEDGLLED